MACYTCCILDNNGFVQLQVELDDRSASESDGDFECMVHLAVHYPARHSASATANSAELPPASTDDFGAWCTTTHIAESEAAAALQPPATPPRASSRASGSSDDSWTSFPPDCSTTTPVDGAESARATSARLPLHGWLLGTIAEALGSVVAFVHPTQRRARLPKRSLNLFLSVHLTFRQGFLSPGALRPGLRFLSGPAASAA